VGRETTPGLRRTNDEWLVALRSAGERQTAALSDLRGYLVRAALYALHRARGPLGDVAPTDLAQLAEDAAQDALSAILEHLEQFRGESRFTTWAYKFAINAALVAARRERWGRVRLDRLLEGPDLVERVGFPPDPSADPQRRVLQEEMLAALREGIERHLTSRQRQALTAIVFEQVPLDELARHWGSNRNALYKLLHDARRRLKTHLRERGFEATEILDAFGHDR
jgi:RNA polymerase sigma-70 factor, ECF subfamily